MDSVKKFLFLVAIFLSATIYSQENEKKESIKLNIKVKDAKNNPVPGAIILIDDVRQGRVANSEGTFKINLKKAPKEIAAFTPMLGIKKIKYIGQEMIIIVLNPEVNTTDLNIADANYKNDNPIQYRNIYDYLRGKVPGVYIDSELRITIRGYNTVLGNRSPLYILNGNQVDLEIFSNIVPTTIKYVKVLKGPETSTYGSRGANGVIIVQTL